MRTLNHRRAARGSSGYMCWSLLDGSATLRMPWSDLMPNGHLSYDELAAVYTTLHDFEAALARSAERGEDETMPAMPTPNAQLVHLDDGEFHAELARRVTAYKGMLQRKAEYANG